jgi:inorganic triphosphatase YgiF
MTASSQLPSNVESEITLIVASEDPERIRASLTAIDRIGDYELVPAQALIIEDVYLDTAFRDLGRHSWVLRVRRQNGNTYFTIKGPARRTEWGGVQRIEIEEPWSREALARIMSHPAVCGTQVAQSQDVSADAPAVEALKSCGFVILQQRQTRRDRRMVIFSGENAPKAELVLDRVLYRFRSQEIRHMEIEIEIKDLTGGSHARALADCLLEAFGQEVRPWHYGKTATGRILESMLENRELNALVRADNYLSPTVYTLIESRMTKR